MSKIKMIVLLLMLVPLALFSQTTKQKDSLINVMCKELNTNKQLSNSERIEAIAINHISHFIDKYDRNGEDSLGINIFYRFQRNCIEFTKILDDFYEPKGDWEIIEGEKPEGLLKKRACRKLTNFKQLSYLENNGDVVKVMLKDGYWIETFLDGTTSKLYFKWTNKCGFELEFIESNNESRSNLSVVGDIYIYEIINTIEDNFEAIISIDENDVYMKFVIYTE